MKKKVVLWIASILLVVFGILGYIASKYTEDVVITEKMIQEQVYKKLPLTKNIVIGEIVIDKADVSINNEIGVMLYGHSVIMDKNIPFNATTQGKVTYDNGQFFYNPSNFNIHLETTKNEKEKTEETIKEETTKSKIFSFVQKKATEIGFNKNDVEKKLNEVVSNEVKDIPVYKLKEGFIKASLEEVKIENNEIHIKMSMIGFTKYAILYIGGVLITILTIIGLLISINNNSRNQRNNSSSSSGLDIIGDIGGGVFDALT